jgi:hypothetical protein
MHLVFVYPLAEAYLFCGDLQELRAVSTQRASLAVIDNFLSFQLCDLNLF